MNTASSISTSTSFYCKYHLPCGYCELKKEQCTWFSYTMPKEWFEPQKNIPVTIYGCPSWEVTCNVERSEDGGRKMRLIDADALKENARKWLPMSRETVVFNLFDLIDNLVNNMPTIDPVKHGRWRVCCYQNKKCSECGYIIGDDDAKEFHYCPNCGAKMDGGEE